MVYPWRPPDGGALQTRVEDVCRLPVKLARFESFFGEALYRAGGQEAGFACRRLHVDHGMAGWWGCHVVLGVSAVDLVVVLIWVLVLVLVVVVVVVVVLVLVLVVVPVLVLVGVIGLGLWLGRGLGRGAGLVELLGRTSGGGRATGSCSREVVGIGFCGWLNRGLRHWWCLSRRVVAC
jgi:hypothetical protein